jgi:glycosyltransferase involved in cell wall biosynthesis
VKILFVHEVSYRKKVIFEMHEFPELLASRGHEVTFFDFDEGARFWSGGLTPRKQSIPGRVHSGTSLKLVRPAQLGIPGIDRILVTLTSWFGLWRTLARGNFDAMVLLAVPTYGLQAITLAKIFGVPVAFRALDVSHKIRNNTLGFAIKGVEKFVYKNADLVIGNNPAMTEYCDVMGQRSARQLPSETLLAPLDLEHFRPKETSPGLAENLGIRPTDKVITYMGSFFYFSGLGQVIDAFSRLIESGSATGTKLLLIGGGEQDVELRAQVARLGLTDSVIFTGFINYAELPGYLGLTSVAINPLQKSLVTDTALPHKVLQYLAMGLPVVSSELKGLQAVFGEDSGIVWGANPADILEKSVKLANDQPRRVAASDSAKSAMAAKFAPNSAINQLEATLVHLSLGADRK